MTCTQYAIKEREETETNRSPQKKIVKLVVLLV